VLAASAGSQRKVVVAAFPEAEADLVRYARDLPFVDFVRVVKHWEDVVDQDGAERKADRDREARRLSVSPTMDGTVVIDGQLDAVEGTELMTALRRIDRELFLAEWAKVVDEHGDAAARSQLTRTSAQRRADALVEMARRAMAAPQGARLPEPLVTVVVGLDTLSGRVCELFNRLPVTPGQIARRLDRADVERIVFSGKRRVIDLGRRERFFKGGLRRVIEIRDRECTYAGCTVPADECQMDHIHPHGLGGETTQENGQARCGPHNRHRNNEIPALRGKKRTKKGSRSGRPVKVAAPCG
jgi:5-methylcytosine-specific restriction endonuclease McrA